MGAASHKIGADTYIVTVTNANGCADTDTIVIDVVSGINNQNSTNNNQLKIYPNPNTGKFTIELVLSGAEGQIIITNITGQSVYTETLSSIQGSYQKHLDLNEFAKGIYTLELITNEGIINKKIIIE